MNTGQGIFSFFSLLQCYMNESRATSGLSNISLQLFSYVRQRQDLKVLPFHNLTDLIGPFHREQVAMNASIANIVNMNGR